MTETTDPPLLRCSSCDAVLLAVDARPLTGEEIAAASALHYATAHGRISVPPQRVRPPSTAARPSTAGA